jgi:hypothetical protein
MIVMERQPQAICQRRLQRAHGEKGWPAGADAVYSAAAREI